MKRSPTPARVTPLKTGSGLRRLTELRRVSKKRAKEGRERRALVVALLAERPWCEIRWDENCQGRAVDVDEIRSRARGGDFLNPADCQTAYRYCHDRKHAEPTEAVRRGVARNSWDGGDAA